MSVLFFLLSIKLISIAPPSKSLELFTKLSLKLKEIQESPARKYASPKPKKRRKKEVSKEVIVQLKSEAQEAKTEGEVACSIIEECLERVSKSPQDPNYLKPAPGYLKLAPIWMNKIKSTPGFLFSVLPKDTEKSFVLKDTFVDEKMARLHRGGGSVSTSKLSHVEEGYVHQFKCPRNQGFVPAFYQNEPFMYFPLDGKSEKESQEGIYIRANDYPMVYTGHYLLLADNKLEKMPRQGFFIEEESDKDLKNGLLFDRYWKFCSLLDFTSFSYINTIGSGISRNHWHAHYFPHLFLNPKYKNAVHTTKAQYRFDLKKDEDRVVLKNLVEYLEESPILMPFNLFVYQGFMYIVMKRKGLDAPVTRHLGKTVGGFESAQGMVVEHPGVTDYLLELSKEVGEDRVLSEYYASFLNTKEEWSQLSEDIQKHVDQIQSHINPDYQPESQEFRDPEARLPKKYPAPILSPKYKHQKVRRKIIENQLQQEVSTDFHEFPLTDNYMMYIKTVRAQRPQGVAVKKKRNINFAEGYFTDHDVEDLYISKKGQLISLKKNKYPIIEGLHYLICQRTSQGEWFNTKQRFIQPNQSSQEIQKGVLLDNYLEFCQNVTEEGEMSGFNSVGAGMTIDNWHAHYIAQITDEMLKVVNFRKYQYVFDLKKEEDIKRCKDLILFLESSRLLVPFNMLAYKGKMYVILHRPNKDFPPLPHIEKGLAALESTGVIVLEDEEVMKKFEGDFPEEREKKLKQMEEVAFVNKSEWDILRESIQMFDPNLEAYINPEYRPEKGVELFSLEEEYEDPIISDEEYKSQDNLGMHVRNLIYNKWNQVRRIRRSESLDSLESNTSTDTAYTDTDTEEEGLSSLPMPLTPCSTPLPEDHDVFNLWQLSEPEQTIQEEDSYECVEGGELRSLEKEFVFHQQVRIEGVYQPFIYA